MFLLNLWSSVSIFRQKIPSYFEAENNIYTEFPREKVYRIESARFNPWFVFCSLSFLMRYPQSQLCIQKQSSRGVLEKSRAEDMQQIYRRRPMPKCDIALRHGCSPVNLLHIFRTSFLRNTSGWLLPCILLFELLFHNAQRSVILKISLFQI